MTEKRGFGGLQGAVGRQAEIESRNKIVKLEEENDSLKQRIKALEYDVTKGKNKRKEWGKKEGEAANEQKLKDLKLKVTMALNQAKIQEKENDKLKEVISQMVQRNEKNERRDTKIFERVFGAKPKTSETKIRDLITGYENQKDRLEQRISALETQLQKVSQINVDLINENKSLTKGNPHSQYYYQRDEGKLVKKLEELEKTKDNLMKALARKEEIIESNLQELDTVKEVKDQLLSKIKSLEGDLKSGPSITDLHSLNNKITKLEKEKDRLQRDNDNLENEIMILRNNTNGHVRQYSSIQKQSRRLDTDPSIPQTPHFEYDESSSTTVLNKILEILSIKTTLGRGQIIETVQKIQRVVLAVPRMEAFIKQVTSAVFPDVSTPALDHIIPEIHSLHHKIGPLLSLKKDLVYLLKPYEIANFESVPNSEV